MHRLKLLTHLILIVYLFVATIGCSGPVAQNNTDSAKPVSPYIGTGKLLPINPADKNYAELGSYTKDTITPQGWTIKYFIKDDSTRYKDLYIEWGKGTRKGYYKAKDVLTYRRYFIPKYVGEQESGIFFWHGCATDCQAVLVLSKDTMGGFNDYVHVVDYNAKLGQVLYVTDNTYKNQDKLFELSLIDLARKRQHNILYKAIARGTNMPRSVEKVAFGDNKITITTNLFSSLADTVGKKEIRTVILDR